MPDYRLYIRVGDETYYQTNFSSSGIEEGTVLELPKTGDNTLNVANPIIWTI